MHKHADILIAIANDKPVEQRLFDRWIPTTTEIALKGIANGHITLRVKPEEEEPAKIEW
jgi:hypothetical protein